MSARSRSHRTVTGLAVVLALSLVSACASSATGASKATTTTTAAPAAAPATTLVPLAGCVDSDAAASPPVEGNETESFPPLSPMPTPGRMPNGSYMAEIQQRGRLIVGTAADVLLYAYRNPKTGKIEGFDVDVAREVAKAIFGDTGNIDDHIEFKIITYAQRIPNLEQQSVDLVAHTMTINCKRWSVISFSSQYYDAHQKLLVSTSDTTTKQLEDLTDKTVCVAKGSTNLEELKKDKYAKVKRAEVDDLSDCLVLFQQGKADAITGDDTVLIGFKAQDPYARIVDGDITNEPYGLGTNKDHPEFTQFVNGVLENMRRDGTWTDLYQTNITDKAGGTTPDPPPAKTGRTR